MSELYLHEERLREIHRSVRQCVKDGDVNGAVIKCDEMIDFIRKTFEAMSDNDLSVKNCLEAVH
jgi:hypothetical protein